MVVKEDIPISWRQILYLMCIMFIPLVFSGALLLWSPLQQGHTPSGRLVAIGVVASISAGLVGILIATVKRRVVEISPSTLVIRHSIYTLVVPRDSIISVELRQVSSVDQLGLSVRKNGIAAFGYFSGWFTGIYGDLTFCAISKWPVYEVNFKGHAKCKRLALSVNAAVADAIAEWGRG